MRIFPVKKKKSSLERVSYKNWVKGLNTLVSNSQIKRDELSVLTDCQLVEDGKIQCPRDGQAYYGGTSGSRVTGLFPYYKADGTNELLRMSATTLQKYNAGSWDNIAGFTYTTTLNTDAVTAYDNVYVCNGTDALTKYDGSSITSFTEISAPNAPTVTRTGTTGSYVFSYKITAITAVGETTPSTAGTSDLNTSTLSDTAYMSLSWAAVTNAIGYNVYGRKDGNWKFMAYLDGNGSTTFVDKGASSYEPQEFFSPPEGNTTGGAKGKYIELYKDTLFIAGDSTNPSRIYYSGGGDMISDFTVSNGGGFVDVSKNDGQVITGMIPYRNYLLIFKEDSTYQFAFGTDGLPSVIQISASVGAIAPRSIVAVENDVFFASRRGIFTVGNEAGYGFDILRTNELSARIRPIFQTIATAYIENIAAVYATNGSNNLVIFSYTPSGSTTNSKAIIYDRERLCWYEWTNITANCWCQYIDSNGAIRVLYGDDGSGYVKEILTGDDDFGSSVSGTLRMISDTFDKPMVYKTLKDIDLLVREPTGTITCNVIVDGVSTELTFPITTVSPIINFGHYVFTDFLFGESSGTGLSSQDENIPKSAKNVNIEGRSFGLELKNSSGGHFTLLYASLLVHSRNDRYRKSEDLVQV